MTSGWRRRIGCARTSGQVLEEYVLLLGLVAVPVVLALPSLVASLQAWTARLLAWWSLPIP